MCLISTIHAPPRILKLDGKNYINCRPPPPPPISPQSVTINLKGSVCLYIPSDNKNIPAAD